MAKFMVKVLRVQGINNKTYVAGETVYDYNFPEGNAKKLLEDGKLTLIEPKKTAEKEAPKKPEKKAEKEEAN